MEAGMEMSVFRARPTDLATFLPYACGQLEAPFGVRVLLQPADEYINKTGDDKGKKMKGEKSVMMQAQGPATDSAGSVAPLPPPAADYGDEDEVVLRACCDAAARPVELIFYRCSQVPRLLIKIIGLCIPFHEQLTRITIRWGPLDGSVVHEIANFLPTSQITDLCLDDSPAPQRNYHLLLERPSRLRGLSLARCDLDDEAAAALAARLRHPLPAARTLTTLSLTGNRVGDEGARAFADALRTNRTLRHLGLAGNAITIAGASHIFRVLELFLVSSDEIVLKRRRVFEHLKLKREAYERCYRELASSREASSPESARSRRRPTLRSRRASTVALGASHAESLAEELVGECAEPFDVSELSVRGGVAYCVGNFALASLDLAYNELECGSAARLARVLSYQASVGARRAGAGLLRAALDGHALPECSALQLAAALLERAQAPPDAPPPSRSIRKGERAKIKTK